MSIDASAGETRYQEEVNDSMIVFLDVEPERGPPGETVTLTAYVMDAGRYVDADELTVTAELEYDDMKEVTMHRVHDGLYEGEFDVPEDYFDYLRFHLQAEKGLNQDHSSGYYHTWDLPECYDIEATLEGGPNFQPGDVVNFTIEVTDRRTGALGDPDCQVNCTFREGEDDYYDYYFYDHDGDYDDEGDEEDIPIFKTGVGAWAGSVSIPPDITQSTVFDLTTWLRVEHEGGGYSSIGRGKDLCLTFFDVWYHNVSISEDEAEFDLYVTDLDGYPVPEAQVSCEVMLMDWDSDEDEESNDTDGDDIDTLSDETTDDDGRATFIIEYDDGVDSIGLRGQVTYDGFTQNYVGDLQTPNTYESEDYDYVREPDGRGLEVMLQSDNDHDFGEDVELEYIAYYTEYDGGYGGGSDPEPLADASLFYYVVSGEYEDHVMDHGTVTTDGDGRLTLEFSVPDENDFSDDFAEVDVWFETPVGEAEGETEDGLEYEDYCSWEDIYFYEGCGSDDFYTEDDDIVISLDQAVSGELSTVEVSYRGGGRDLEYDLSWWIVDDDFTETSLLEAWMHLDYDIWTANIRFEDHFDEAQDGGGGMEGTFRIPLFAHDSNQLYIVAWMAEDDELLGVNYLLVPIEGQGPPSDETILGPFLSADGDPIEGATVTMTSDDGDEFVATTDDDGYADFGEILPLGTYTCEVEVGDDTVIDPFEVRVSSRGTPVYPDGSSPPESKLDSSEMPENTYRKDDDGDSTPGFASSTAAIALTMTAAALALFSRRSGSRRRRD